MKGFLIFVILSCLLITFAYVLKFYNKPKTKPKKRKNDLDVPIKDVIYKKKKNN